MRTRKTAEERRDEIVSAALTLADEIGPDRVTTQKLAEVVGLTQAGLFRHFPKKQHIWESVAKHIGHQMQLRWTRSEQRRGDTPEQRICHLVLGQLQLIQSFPAIPSLLFSRELLVENQRLREAFAGMLGAFHDLLKKTVSAAQDDDLVRSDADPGDVALLLIALIQGLAARWSVSGRRFNLLKEGQRLLKLQLQGLRSSTNSGAKPMPGSPKK